MDSVGQKRRVKGRKVDYSHNPFGMSSREFEVAREVAKAMSNQKIADYLFVTISTIRFHLNSIYKKTGCRNRLALILLLSESLPKVQ